MIRTIFLALVLATPLSAQVAVMPPFRQTADEVVPLVPSKPLYLGDATAGTEVGDPQFWLFVRSLWYPGLTMQSTEDLSQTILWHDNGQHEFVIEVTEGDPPGPGNPIHEFRFDAHGSAVFPGLTLDDPLSLLNGGTNATNAADARENLGLHNFAFSVVVFVPTADNATGDDTITFPIPNHLDGGVITSVTAFVNTAGVDGTLTVQLDNNGSDLFSTPLTVDDSETDSTTAATPAVINTANDDLTGGGVIGVDIDAVHVTAPAKGLTLLIEGTR